jgi:hypothetical protein
LRILTRRRELAHRIQIVPDDEALSNFAGALEIAGAHKGAVLLKVGRWIYWWQILRG